MTRLGLWSVAVLVFLRKMNVLFLAVDDLKPMIAAYEPPAYGFMQTPHMDRLAADSLLLRQAHVQQAICGASRASVLTGRRPDTTHVYDISTYFRDVGCAECVTIPGLFKEAGYETLGMGKIFHPAGMGSEHIDGLHSWSDPDSYFYPADDWQVRNMMAPGLQEAGLRGNYSWLAIDESDGKTQDTLVAEHAVRTIANLSAATAAAATDAKSPPAPPFFLAVGFHKPHLPWIVPERFFNVRSRRKKTCNSSIVTILTPIALLCRECYMYAYYFSSWHGNRYYF